MGQTIRTVKLPWSHRILKLGCESQFEVLVIDLKLFYYLSDSSNYPFYVHLAQSLDYLQTFCPQCRAAMHAIQQQLENMAHWFESHVLVTNCARQSGGGAEWIGQFGWSSFYNAAGMSQGFSNGSTFGSFQRSSAYMLKWCSVFVCDVWRIAYAYMFLL